METSSRFPPLWLTMLASTPVTCWLERQRRSAAGPTFFSMSLVTVTEVPVDLGVVVQALLGTNSSTSVEVGEQWGVDGVEEVPVENALSMATTFNGRITKDEDSYQNLLLVVEGASQEVWFQKQSRFKEVLLSVMIILQFLFTVYVINFV